MVYPFSVRADLRLPLTVTLKYCSMHSYQSIHTVRVWASSMSRSRSNQKIFCVGPKGYSCINTPATLNWATAWTWAWAIGENQPLLYEALCAMCAFIVQLTTRNSLLIANLNCFQLPSLLSTRSINAKITPCFAECFWHTRFATKVWSTQPLFLLNLLCSSQNFPALLLLILPINTLPYNFPTALSRPIAPRAGVAIFARINFNQ